MHGSTEAPFRGMANKQETSLMELHIKSASTGFGEGH